MEIFTTSVIGVFLYAFPFKAWNFMFRNRRELPTQNYRLSYDSLYQNIDLTKGPIALSFLLIFCLRRLAFAYSVSIMLRIAPQVFFADFFSLYILGYLYCLRPMVDRTNNFIQIFNEHFV